jgi:hypothetical protein
MQLQFVESESTFAYFHAARAYLEAWGKPVAILTTLIKPAARETDSRSETEHPAVTIRCPRLLRAGLTTACDVNGHPIWLFSEYAGRGERALPLIRRSTRDGCQPSC